MSKAKKISFSTILSILAIVLVIPFVFMLTGCGSKLNVKEVNTQEALIEAIADEKVDEIKLTSNIDLDTSLRVSRKVTIKLNGKTLKGNGYDGVFYVSIGGELTISGDGNVIAKGGFDDSDTEHKSEYAMAIWANGGKVIINGGTYSQVTVNGDSQYDMIYVSDYTNKTTGEVAHGEITILSGEFESVTPKWTLNINDKAVESKFIVKGGVFKGYNPAEAMTEPNSPVNFVAEGYKAVLVEGSTTDYKVVKE